jgi:hypothetical protein
MIGQLVVLGRMRPSKVIAKALSAGFVRREALVIRVGVRDLRRRAVAAVR